MKTKRNFYLGLIFLVLGIVIYFVLLIGKKLLNFNISDFDYGFFTGISSIFMICGMITLVISLIKERKQSK